jgi:hypothetical protein
MHEECESTETPISIMLTSITILFIKKHPSESEFYERNICNYKWFM